ncbi:hypothetical protein RB195_017956 [Necator americanus]|uniref:Cysteine protease n=1 Tax=Necator americanus TaxID=51031 RepID=A0ABR1CAG5_NECAM
MRQLRRIRLSLLAVAMMLCMYWIFYGDEITINVGDPPVLTGRIPQEWIEMCEFLERSWQGDEGPIDDTGYRLRGVAIAFRHGERSPMKSANDKNACAPFREDDRRDFEQYRLLVGNEDFQFFLRHDAKFKTFPWAPSGSECSPGQMTAEGALQHVKLGKYMRSKYAGSNIFSQESHLNVSVTSSQFNRTFQSAIAFTSSFLYPSRASVPQIFVRASNFTFMCTNVNCQCDLAKQWRLRYEEEHANYFLKRSPEHLRIFAESLRKHPDFSWAIDPLQVVDVALGKYICRRRPLPCFGKESCLSYDFLNQLLNETSVRGKIMFDEGLRYISQKLHLVEAHGVLFHITETVRKLRKFAHTNIIQIFSGHDVMLAPLLRVMGVPFTDPPHYVSHLIVEFYEDVGNPSVKDALHLRFIYNGVDVTKNVIFCEMILKNGLCPAHQLEEFLHSRIFAPLGVVSMKEGSYSDALESQRCEKRKEHYSFDMSVRPTSLQNGCTNMESPGNVLFSEADSAMSSLEEPCCSSPRSSISDLGEFPCLTSAPVGEEAVSEGWFRNKLRKASSVWSNWRSNEPVVSNSSTWKNKISSAWNNIKYSEKWMQFANDDYSSDGFKRIVLLGLSYCPEDSECDCGMDFIDFYRDYNTRIWITYRTGMAPLPGTQITSDCGWGCMIRTTQMAVAQALLLNRTNRGNYNITSSSTL